MTADPRPRRSAKVFGIGWAKTGTTTLGTCFSIFGYKHQGQALELVADLGRGDLSRILALAQRKETFEDWPWLLLYKQLDAAFPGSLFVLTTRKTERWLKSYRNMLETQGAASDSMNEVRRILYGLPFPQVSDQQLVDRYEKHNSDVAKYFRVRQQDLLIVDWESGDGWEQLCGFLRIAVPKDPFPHMNKGTYQPR